MIPTHAWARLPKPLKLSGIVLAVDLGRQTLRFEHAKSKKTFVLDWNKDTDFSRNNRRATPAELKPGTAILIYYKEVSFHNPLLKKVSWTGAAEN